MKQNIQGTYRTTFGMRLNRRLAFLQFHDRLPEIVVVVQQVNNHLAEKQVGYQEAGKGNMANCLFHGFCWRIQI
ncbi:hypothetical protein D4L85_31605 [Chryseolinea soli]|uniref:Uncharacterized protein n=1 Tax=Chryseolinea soli TaxID=2321403 RepID=A0A385SYL8_9BACT|nr:hypothetical protein D4L85_31605 [Chryseolinea soli]